MATERIQKNNEVNKVSLSAICHSVSESMIQMINVQAIPMVPNINQMPIRRIGRGLSVVVAWRTAKPSACVCSHGPQAAVEQSGAPQLGQYLARGWLWL